MGKEEKVFEEWVTEMLENLLEKIQYVMRKEMELKQMIEQHEEYIVRFTVEILEDGRVTIPSAIRKKYHMRKGDLLELGLIRLIQ